MWINDKESILQPGSNRDEPNEPNLYYKERRQLKLFSPNSAPPYPSNVFKSGNGGRTME
jgi:hypothetical protein